VTPPVAQASTRERLLSATLELLAAGGYADATVARITGRAGVASGTLYRHFASKEELFVELFREICSGEIDAMRAAAAELSDPLEQLTAALETFALRALAHPKLAWALLAEPVDPLVDAERLEYRRRYRDLVKGLLDEALERGEIPPADTALLAAAIVGGVGEVLVGPLSSRSDGVVRDAALVAEIRTFARRAAAA
jgi:AcrR family transcriptional regulator